MQSHEDTPSTQPGCRLWSVALALPARREEGAPSGWDRYVALLEQERIPECTRRWYVVRAEAFVAAMRPKRSGELTPEKIKAFLPRYAREQRLTNWQYRQTVEAVRLLLVRLGGCRAAQQVEWDFLVEVGQALPADHPTRMGAVTPAEVIDRSPRYSSASASGSMSLARSNSRLVWLQHWAWVRPVRWQYDA